MDNADSGCCGVVFDVGQRRLAGSRGCFDYRRTSDTSARFVTGKFIVNLSALIVFVRAVVFQDTYQSYKGLIARRLRAGQIIG